MQQAILMKKGKNEQEMLHGDTQAAAAITIAAKVQLILTNMGSCCSSSS